MLPKEESPSHGFPHPLKLPGCLPMLPTGRTSWQASGQANLGNTVCRETMENAKRHRDLTNDEIMINTSVKLYTFQMSTSHRHIYIHACQCTHAPCIKSVFSHRDSGTVLWNEYTEDSLGCPTSAWVSHRDVYVPLPPGPPSHFLPLPTPLLLLLSRFSHVRLCATPEMAAHQAPPSLGFSRQEHRSGLPFPSPMHESEKWKWSCSVVSDSSRPHGLQSTRLLRPWDSPGKGTGVVCHCLLSHSSRLLQSPVPQVIQWVPIGYLFYER